LRILKIVPASREKWERFYPYLNQELLALENNRFNHETTADEDGGILLQCCRYPAHLTLSEVVDTYRHFFSTALAEYTIEEVEKERIQHMIKHEFAYSLESQISAIYRYCHYLLFMDEDKNSRDELKIVGRKCKVFKKAYEYLEEEKEFNLDGFLRFRLKEYSEELAQVIEYAVDEYIVDKEYQEFIQLLRYFISKQEAKLPFLHVFHIQDRQFLLFDEECEIISEKEVEFYLKKWAIHSISYEDIIVSTLITIAPKRLVLHTDEPASAVIETLKSIFQAQLTICMDCDHCQKWRSKQNAETKSKG
jgi:putative sporulation protein YtxC